MKYRLGKPWKHTGRGLEKLGEEADRQAQCAGTVRGEEGWWFVTKNDIKIILWAQKQQ